MKKVIYYFLTHPVTAIMLFFAVVILGVGAFLNLPIELTPEVEYPRLSITSSWNGVSPEAVEAYLTSPLEAALSSIKGIKKITSRSSLGYCSVNLEFQPDINMDFIKIEINEKINAIKDELPEGISPPRLSAYIPQDFRELQGFLTYTITANVSSNEIRKYVETYIKTPLLTIPGIANVEITGGNEREIEIKVDYDKAKYFGITNEEISLAVSNSQKYQTAGFVNSNHSRILIQIADNINNTSQILNQPVKILNNGQPVRLKDIASASDAFSEPSSYYRINGKEAVFVKIEKESGSNMIDAADRLYDKIEELNAKLPPGYIIRKEIDKTDYIRKDINSLYKNASYSILILIVILFILFRKIKYSLIIITSIFFSLLSSFILFNIFKVPLNILTIASITLGFGMMVDNSIVVIDYVDHHYDGRGAKRLSVYVKDIFFPVFASTLTTIAVFVPLIFLTGELKLYFAEFALAIVFSLTCSLIISFTVIPLLFLKFYGSIKPVASPEKRSLIKLIYFFVEDKVFRFKKSILFLLVLIVGLPFWLLPSSIGGTIFSEPYNYLFGSDFYQDIKKYVNLYLGGTLNLFFNEVQKGEVFNYGEDTYLIVSLRLPNGNTLERLNSLTKSFEEQILPYKNKYKDVISNVINSESAYIRVDFNKQQSETAFPYILKNYLTAYAVMLGGLNVGVYGFGPGFYSGGSAISSFTVIATGFNYLEVKKIAEKFKSEISKNPRIDNVDIDKSFAYGSDDDRFEIVAAINRNELINHNLSISSIFDNVAKNSEGNIQYNIIKVNNDEVKYSIKFSNYRSQQLNELKDLRVMDKEGSIIKLKNLISFDKKKVLANILRENRQYVRYISFDYKGPYQYGRDFIKSAISNSVLPPGYLIKMNEGYFRFGEEEEIEIWKILSFGFILIYVPSGIIRRALLLF